MSRKRGRVPAPAKPPAAGEMPRTLTFVLTEAERAEVLAVLRRYSHDRAEALRLALGIDRTPPRRGGQ